MYQPFIIPEAALWRVRKLLAVSAACFHTDFLLGLFLDPEDGGDMFLQNVG
jgi:hypothetical protein